MKDKQVPIELIDEMTKVKADFKVLYIYEPKYGFIK